MSSRPRGLGSLDASSSNGDGAGAAEPDGMAAGREQVRQRVIEAAIDLLTREGRDAVTTRRVAVAAGLQPPAIYRLFGDKDGLLDAVAEHGFSAVLAGNDIDAAAEHGCAVSLAAKHIDHDPVDPIEDLRAGWDLAVEFGLANPALYTLMYSEPPRAAPAAFNARPRTSGGRIRR